MAEYKLLQIVERHILNSDLVVLILIVNILSYLILKFQSVSSLGKYYYVNAE